MFQKKKEKEKCQLLKIITLHFLLQEPVWISPEANAKIIIIIVRLAIETKQKWRGGKILYKA